jgi:RHS repeat-associated protein
VQSELAAGRTTIALALKGVSVSDAQFNFNSRTGSVHPTIEIVQGPAPAQKLFYAHVDHLDTPRELYSQSQQLVWRRPLAEPFGDTPPDENPSGLGVFVYPKAESDYYDDKETGLRYAMFRDCYDPKTGRFCQSDPIGLSGGLNTYAYAYANPLFTADPLGLVDTVTSRITVLAGQGRVAELQALVRAGALTPSQEATAIGAISRLEQGIQGAKSAGELAKHVERLQEAREGIDKLQRLIRQAGSKKTRDRLAQELEDLLRSIRGHEKEIQQKWPDVAEVVCP